MIKASIIIPTKNGGEQFKSVVNAVLTQKCPWDFELLVIDSGSRDGTVQYCLERSVPVHTIPSHEFGHGKTRNLGASLTKGEYLVFLTQDAIPANSAWLASFIKAMDDHPEAAGAFGRHFPHPDSDPYVARDLWALFDGFLAAKHISRIEDVERYKMDAGYRQFLHFFSNNNSCLRRNAWESFPFPDVEFAEDQIWAKNVIEAGYSKLYVDHATVFHSHNFSTLEALRRAFDESTALHNLFGYEMCPTVKHLFVHAFLSTMQDISFTILLVKSRLKYSIRTQTAAFDEINRVNLARLSLYLLRSPFYQFSRMVGYYLGGRHKKIPQRLRYLLSLDKAMKSS
jgi:rhamnosyltransferase